MFVLEPLFEFSRQNCITICAFLVSANLLTTVITLILLFSQRPLAQIRLNVTLATLFAVTLFLHVSTWFLIGVVTPVTFILVGLGTTCLIVNIWAMLAAKDTFPVFRKLPLSLLNQVNLQLKVQKNTP
jgi:hypothetical protein